MTKNLDLARFRAVLQEAALKGAIQMMPHCGGRRPPGKRPHCPSCQESTCETCDEPIWNCPRSFDKLPADVKARMDAGKVRVIPCCPTCANHWMGMSLCLPDDGAVIAFDAATGESTDLRERQNALEAIAQARAASVLHKLQRGRLHVITSPCPGKPVCSACQPESCEMCGTTVQVCYDTFRELRRGMGLPEEVPENESTVVLCPDCTKDLERMVGPPTTTSFKTRTRSADDPVTRFDPRRKARLD